MHFKYLFVVVFVLLLGSFQGYSLSEKATISILTIDPGNKLYTIFGHSAIRITDETTQIDKVYSFGTFDFCFPSFHIELLRGNLSCFLSVADFKVFRNGSLKENRKICEQILDFSYNEKQMLFYDLENRYNSPKRFYKYDFLYCNCATGVRDAIFNSKATPINYDKAKFCCQTFRKLIKPYISINYWLDLGINLSLGNGADKIASSNDYMFLPDYIFSILDDSQIVLTKKILLDPVIDTKSSKLSYFSPWVIVSILIITAFWNKTQRLTFCFVTFAIGVLGLILLFMSFLFKNSIFQNNFNIYWTLPSLLILIVKRKRLRNWLEMAYISELLMLLIFWNNLPQDFSITFIPWITILITIQSIDILTIYRIKSFANSVYKPLLAVGLRIYARLVSL
jgi:hypothetical protein